MRLLFKTLLWLILLGFIAVFAVVGFAYHWVNKPLELVEPVVDVRVPAGVRPGQIGQLLVDAGVVMPPEAFGWVARLTGQDRDIKAGGYQVSQGDSLADVVRRMAQGEVTQRQVTFIEGWTIEQIMQALAAHPDVEKTIEPNLLQDHRALASRFGVEQERLEGLVFPDTYVFAVGASDEEILRRALKTQEQVVERAWEDRVPNLPLKNPYEALILASIVEKETGQANERRRVAGVFINRLRKGMLLQTDPTVIYGMGDRYQGRIRKADLQRDTPWNTYIRAGLPPTPIAAPSKASLEAVLNPEEHDYYYFVARGDGTSAFAKTLREHNRNVAKYILGR
ncbi:endolytic transglycosylase MltG [Orrella daihaiensis]|uniref:Endolytic murein transglycosylase n=1 Tax=Orrella daihaiensis TaxID=2782176 RepID=A0ABY4AHG6_9BURK|nr:endolytic transglycosylase MltG [Orrella daihaiensis]UOD49353.1 endolytic transglycosylase MltG [Orrella daihaiensis]